MSPLPIASRATLAAFAAALAACSAPVDRTASDSTLARDLALASSSESRPAPRTAFADTAVGVRPLPTPAAPTTTAAPVTVRAPEPKRTPNPWPTAEHTVAHAPADSVAPPVDSAPAAPAAPAAHPSAGRTIAAGTTMSLATAGPICSTSNRPGDRFVATLRDPVAASDGTTLPAGTDVVVELSSVITGPQNHGRVELIARGISIDGFIKPIDAEVAWIDAVLERRRVPTPGAKSAAAGTIGRGAMTGAILGRVLGGRSNGGKGTAIGAAAGAAVGAASAKGAMVYESCLPAGAPVRMRLTGPLAISAA